MTKLEFFSATGCPYAHRTRLALIEKHTDFSLTEIDLEHKPDWFLKISPYGKVPLIKHGENCIWESTIINEYLDEVFPHPPLMPQNPAEKALARIWIDFANTKFTPAFYKLLLNQTTEKQQQWAQELRNHLLFMEAGIATSQDGNYWLGDFSLVDISFYPWFERMAVLEHYRGFSLPSECMRLKQWYATMLNRDAVKQIQNPPQLYLQQYVKYANGTASGITAQEMRL